MCLPALAAVPAALASAGSAISGAAMAIPGMSSVMGMAGAASKFAATAKGIGWLQGGLSAGSSIINFMGRRAEAKAQDAMFEQNRQSALAAYRDDIVANNANTMIEQEQATQRRQEAVAEGIAARSRARTALGEAGVGGFTAAAIQRDLLMAQGTNIAAIDRNADLAAVRNQFANNAAFEQTKGRINSVARGQKPSLLALGAQLGGAALSGMKMTKDLKAAEKVAA